MHIEQFVMAYQVEQDRLRAMLPEDFSSLRPVLRINAELRGRAGEETVYLELNTPVEGRGKRGWLNVANWQSPVFSYKRQGKATTFRSEFLEITYTAVGITGGCPAEGDNAGCFFLPDGFVPAETIGENKEFCDCTFAWHFAPGDAQGEMVGGKTLPAIPTESKHQYPREPLTPLGAARIPCEQILGSYTVRFQRP